MHNIPRADLGYQKGVSNRVHLSLLRERFTIYKVKLFFLVYIVDVESTWVARIFTSVYSNDRKARIFNLESKYKEITTKININERNSMSIKIQQL